MPSLGTYHLTWVSFTLDVGYLSRLLQQSAAAAPDLGRGHLLSAAPLLPCAAVRSQVCLIYLQIFINCEMTQP